MENYIVSARKYRPNTWESVVGQDAITSTLRNAISSGKLAQAYLFCGPRGVGKTTCARLFAKAINADTASLDEDFSFNMFELDGASNNKTEDIRALIDQVRIPPQVGTYKVYIIDEVHMLSTAAFNAFLKTLEEPPKHAIFILATTEKHKVLPTILSRCQIYDFNRITVSDMAKHLAYICKEENVQFEEQALHVIAEKADGALRDALSMLDQLISFSGGNLTYDVVIKSLHILDYDYYFRLTNCFLNQDIPQSLLIFDDVLSKGFDGHHFISGIASHLRNLMVCKDASTLKLMDVSEQVKQKYLEQSQKTELPFILQGLEILSKADYEYKQSKNQRLLVELALMQLCSILFEGAEKKKLALN
jgi:DNA polymerase III subunit gamma/tau